MRARGPAAVALLVAATAVAAPERVRVGAFVRNVEALNLEENAYHASLVVWFKWTGERDPTRSVRFVNLLEAWALTSVPVFEEPKLLPDGAKYQQLLVEGRFFHKFWLGTFPLDWQKAVVELEDVQRSADELVFEVDPASGLAEGLVVPGWVVRAPLAEVREVTYPGQLGLPDAQRRSRARFGVLLQRPLRVLFTTMLPPIVLVLVCCWFVFFLRPQHVEARVGTVITALLTVVFLQLAFTEDLPWLGSTVLLDQLFNLSYVMTTAVLLECVVVARWFDQAQAFEARAAGLAGPERAEALEAAGVLRQRLDRLDARARRWFPVAYAVCAGLIVLVGRGLDVFSIPV
ncbi:MAG: hypothetical protein INH41_29320 [Myxococcaceae bacterium]|nr:hypothetical protein [Myxococcaceae bacterium]MCA3016503.1 hypothetical protein [Myxococcaceae bacterium]